MINASEMDTEKAQELPRKKPNYDRLNQEKRPETVTLDKISFRSSETKRDPYEMPDKKYAQQEMIPKSRIEGARSEAAMRAVVETAVTEGSNWDKVEDQAGKSAEDTVRAEAGNIIGAELSARLGTQLDRFLKPNHQEGNAFDKLFASFGNNPKITTMAEAFDRLQAEKSGAASVQPFSDSRIEELQRGGPEAIGLRELVVALAYPEKKFATGLFLSKVREMSKDPDGKVNIKREGRFNDAYVTRMTESLTFLKAVAEVPKARDLLGKELGLSHARPDSRNGEVDIQLRIDNALKAVQSIRGEQPTDPEKYAKDVDTAKKIAAAMPDEIDDRQLEGIEMASVARENLLQVTMEEGDRVGNHHIEKSEKDAEMARLNEVIGTNASKLDKAEGGMFGGMFNRNKLSQSQIEGLTADLQRDQAERERLRADIAKLPVVDLEEKHALEQKKAKLEALRPSEPVATDSTENP